MVEEIRSDLFGCPYGFLKAALNNLEGELRLPSMHGIDLEMGAPSDGNPIRWSQRRRETATLALI